MHERGETDVPAVLLALIIVLLLSLGLVHHIKSRASRQTESRRFQQYLLEGSARREDTQVPMLANRNLCAVCETPSTKRCSGCKAVYYCSTRCQSENWSRGHKFHCRTKNIRRSDTASTKRFQQVCESRGNLTELNNNTDNRSSRISAAPFSVSDGVLSKPDKVLFPYDRFIEYFKWDRMRAPCGLINLGNSCFANVVLQCLTYTRPLTAYLLQRSHQKGCKRNDWCFMCELGNHVVEAFQNPHLNPFSPIRILSRLRDIGNHLGSGRQEDAHEFMRFAIDSMQSICLDEAGGEKVVDPRSQLTTLVQYIFGGLLQSQVKCFQCNHVSNKYENMMDLAVEIQGAVESLEDALTQFTAHEWLDGENKYKCDRCNGYVKASKRLALYEAPNILTIALKRFQSGKFGKLNKRVTFPMDLDMSMYMSEIVDKPLFYQLYAVIVHVDMLNASFFGHYVCYVKDMHGTWYKVDDSKVKEVDIEKVLSQKAYMLMYSRQSVWPGHSTDVRKESPCQAVSASLSASSAHLGEVCNSASVGASKSEKLPFKSLNSSLWTEQGCMSSAGVLAETALRSLPSNPGTSESHFMPMLPFEDVNNLSNVSLQSDASSHGSDNKNEFDTHISLLEACNGDDPLHMKVGKRRFETELYPLHGPEPLEVDQLWPHLSCPPEVSSCFNGTDAQQGRSLNPCFPSSLHEEISCESIQTEQDSPAKRQHLEFCLDHSEESYNVLHKDSGGPKLHFALSEKAGDSIVDTLGQNTGLCGKLSAVSCVISKEIEHMLINRKGENLEGEDLEMPSMICKDNEGPLINIDGKDEGSECDRSMVSKEAECTMMDIEEESECEVAEVCSLAENGLLDTYGGHLQSGADGIEQNQQDIDNLSSQSVSSEIEATCHTPPACSMAPILLNGPSDNGKLLCGITNGNSDDFGSPNSAKVGMVNINDEFDHRPSENPTTSTSRIVDTLKEHVSEIEHIKVMEQSSVVKVSPHAKPLFARGFLDKSSNGKSRTVNLKKGSGVLPVAAAASIQIDFQDKTRLQVPSELEMRPGLVKLDSLGDQGNFVDRTDMEGGKSPMDSSAKPAGSWIKPGFLVKSNSGRNKTFNGSQGNHPILVAPKDSKNLESKLGPDYSLCQEIVKETTAVVPGSHSQAITRQKPRRNDPCACGSQRKWKKCCGENGHL